MRVWPAASQPPFARLDEAKRALTSPLQSGPVAETAEIFVGDSVVDVELFYRSGGGGKIGAYMLGSTLNPGLPQQEQTPTSSSTMAPAGMKRSFFAFAD